MPSWTNTHEDEDAGSVEDEGSADVDEGSAEDVGPIEEDEEDGSVGVGETDDDVSGVGVEDDSTVDDGGTDVSVVEATAVVSGTMVVVVVAGSEETLYHQQCSVSRNHSTSHQLSRVLTTWFPWRSPR